MLDCGGVVAVVGGGGAMLDCDGAVAVAVAGDGGCGVTVAGAGGRVAEGVDGDLDGGEEVFVPSMP